MKRGVAGRLSAAAVRAFCGVTDDGHVSSGTRTLFLPPSASGTKRAAPLVDRTEVLFVCLLFQGVTLSPGEICTFPQVRGTLDLRAFPVVQGDT